MDSSAGLMTNRPGQDGLSRAVGELARRVYRRFRRLTSRPPRPMTRKGARVILACLALLAGGLIWGTVSLAIHGLSAAKASAAHSPTSLIMPAPERAAGLPRHYRLSDDRSDLLAIAQFRQRFARLQGRPVTAYPAALYGEPGRIDLASGSPGWVMYLGYNARLSLGDPAATMTRLMASLAGPTPARSWPVPAGIQGGSARCMVAVIGPMRMSVCGWATDQTIAALMSPTRDTSVTELATLMQLMRANLEPG
jgi:hypothetical protein